MLDKPQARVLDHPTVLPETEGGLAERRPGIMSHSPARAFWTCHDIPGFMGLGSHGVGGIYGLEPFPSQTFWIRNYLEI